MPFNETKTVSAPAEWQSTEPLDPAAWIPIVELALEGFGGTGGSTLEQRTASLRRELADEILLDDIGRPCVARSIARIMFSERASWLAQKQEQQQAREAREKETHAATAKQQQQQALRDRVRALAERGTLGDPLADMKRGDFEDAWDRAAAKRDELATSDATGHLQYHPISEER